MSATRQLCTFTLDSLLFGVDVVSVQEVIRYQAMSPVPLAPATIKGLINLRGQIVTALDMRERLNLPSRAPGDLPMNVVLRSDDGALSLLVDEIGDVVEVHQDAFERAPATIPESCRELIVGVYKLESRLLLLLDTDKATRVDGHGGPAPKRGEEKTARGINHAH